MNVRVISLLIFLVFVFTNSFTQTYIPYVTFSEIDEMYPIETEIEVTGRVYSEGLIDQLCGVGYELYRNGVLIQNVNDYGTITYRVRSQGENYYDGTITEGSGMIQINYLFWDVGAFTLGMFDNYCVERNRPIDFNLTLDVPGEYAMNFSIYQCSNNGNNIGTSYVAVNCDGETYYDRIASSCDNPVQLNTDYLNIAIYGPGSDEAEILSFIINEFEGEIDSEEATVNLMVPYGTDLTNLNADITVSDGAEINQEFTDFSEPRVYTITAEDGITNKEWTVSVVADEFMSLNRDKLDLISVYPNPSDGNFNIDLSNLNGVVNCEIHDLNGRVLFNKKINAKEKGSVHIYTELSAGVYFIRIIEENKISVQKIVVQ
jgi:hypothetical protein